METIRITKSQNFDVILSALDVLAELKPDFSVSFPGTDTREGVTVDIDGCRKFCGKEKELLARKNANTTNPDKMSDTQKENEAFKTEIKDFLATLPTGEGAPEGYSATEILMGTSISKKYQLPKVTALLSALGDGTKTKAGTHEVVRVKGPKGQTLFRLA